MFTGRTYTLSNHDGDSHSYYKLVRNLTDRFLDKIPDERRLLGKIRSESSGKKPWKWFQTRDPLIREILKELESTLAPFLTGVDEHLRTLSITDRFDRTMRTGKEQHLLYMLEIELTNRINRERFSIAPWKMALIAHCLRDFRPSCRSKRGEVEEKCAHCDQECQVNAGSVILERYGIDPYISVSMEHGKLFRFLKKRHPGMGVLGIACIPELVTGLRLCDELGIPAVGIPLDANRCSRWMGRCLETTYNLEELENVIKEVSSV